MRKTISIAFDRLWVLSKKDDDVLPVDAFLLFLKDKMTIEILEKTLTDCVLLAQEGLDELYITETIDEIVQKKMHIANAADVVELSVEDYSAKKEEAEQVLDLEENVNGSSVDSKGEAENEVGSCRDKIQKLIGAEEFKNLAEECIKVAPGLLKHNAVEAFTHQAFLFSINDGNGLSTCLKLFADLLSELKLFQFKEKNCIAEEKLPALKASDHSGSNPFSCVLSHFQKYGNGSGQILCVDISEWMSHIREKRFRDLLVEMEKHCGENIVVFRIPFVEKEVLDKIKHEIGDVLSVRALSFVPFDRAELRQCAERFLAKRGFSVEEDAWDVFQARIAEEKTDGRFYGINTVNKVVREMIYQKQLGNVACDILEDTVIRAVDIQNISATYCAEEENGPKLLDGFVGVDTIRQRVEEIVAQIELAMKHHELGYPCMHMRFLGNPGTGKTTVARVLGQILKEKGLLRNGQFFEYFGRDFCGRYVGETAPKTAAMCRDAYGSVLFIDEAYSLYRDDGYSSADYGREAIDTLIAEMENHRSDLVVIMAGYPDDMNTLMKANAGLESRMPYVIEFPNYSREQLFEIFMLMTQKNFRYLDDFEEEVKHYFDTLPEEILQSKEFSNARFVRNLFERTWGKAALRAQMNKELLSVLTKEDFVLASSEREFCKIMEKQKRTIGFV